MTTNPIPKVGGTKANNNLTGSSPEQQSQGVLDELLAELQEKDPVVFAIGKNNEKTPAPDNPYQSEYKKMMEFFRLMEESNRQIQESAKRWEKYTPKPTAVPSALGMTVSGASAKLKQSDLGVRKVSQEYHERVPAGHVITQVPGPGGLASKQSGVALIISKGPPPEKEKYDTIRKRENVPFLRVKSKRELEDRVRSQLRLSGIDPEAFGGSDYCFSGFASMEGGAALFA